MYVLAFVSSCHGDKNEMRGIKFRIDASRGETNEKDSRRNVSRSADLRDARVREIIKKLVDDFAPHSGTSSPRRRGGRKERCTGTLA